MTHEESVEKQEATLKVVLSLDMLKNMPEETLGSIIRDSFVCDSKGKSVGKFVVEFE
jgi:hypothetical protein